MKPKRLLPVKDIYIVLKFSKELGGQGPDSFFFIPAPNALLIKHLKIKMNFFKLKRNLIKALALKIYT